MEAYKDFPGTSVRLITIKGEAVHQKTDIFKKLMWYWLKEERGGGKIVKLELDRVKEIIALNKEGKKPEDLNKFVSQEQPDEPHYENVVGQDDLTRFDTKFKKQRQKKKQEARSNDKSQSQNKAVKKGPKNKRDKRKKKK